MSQTTIGINIESQAIRFAVCQINGGEVGVDMVGEIPCETSDSDALDSGLKQLSEAISQLKIKQIDAMGLTLDSTCALSAHRILPFNDPKILKDILPQSMMDIWKVDDSAQLSFEVCGFVKGAAPTDEEAENGVTNDGYDIHVINYPRERLADLLAHFNRAQLDPHVAIPSIDAFQYAVNHAMNPPGYTWSVLDIGEDSTQLYVCEGAKVVIARSMKLGLSNMDEALAEALECDLENARQIRMESGFVIQEGREALFFDKLLARQMVHPTSFEPARISQACCRGLSALISAVYQTMGNYVNETHNEPQIIYLTGSGALFNGLDKWLSAAFDGPCEVGLPMRVLSYAETLKLHIDVVSAALAAAANIDGGCSLNLRHDALAHKGSLAYLKDNKWLLGILVLIMLGVFIWSNVSHANAVQKEHDALKAALGKVTQDTFGKKMYKYNEIVSAVEGSQEFDFIPVRTAFSHFSWLSSNVSDNLADVEMDLKSLDIDTQRKIVTIEGEVVGDEGLPRFIQLLEQYECFPNEIPDPKTTKNKDKTSFTLRVDANQCKMGGGDSE